MLFVCCEKILKNKVVKLNDRIKEDWKYKVSTYNKKFKLVLKVSEMRQKKTKFEVFEEKYKKTFSKKWNKSVKMHKNECQNLLC